MFVNFKLMYVLDRHPNVPTDAKRKYPKNVHMPRGQQVTDKCFLHMDLGKPVGKQALMLGLIVIIMIGFLCFNLWPLWLKIGIWYVSFYLLMFLVGIIIIRFVVWLFLFHFGMDFWIFPNFFIDSNDILDSFRPMLSYEKRDDDSKMLLLRVVSAIGLIFMIYQFSQDPENIESLTKGSKEGMDDLFNWGNDRFVMGRLADKSGGGNGTARKKSAREIFEDSFLDGDADEKKMAEEAGFKIPEKNETEEAEAALNATNSTDTDEAAPEVVDNLLDKLNAEDDGDEVEAEAAPATDKKAET
jgi:hypothetical protein